MPVYFFSRQQPASIAPVPNASLPTTELIQRLSSSPAPKANRIHDQIKYLRHIKPPPRNILCRGGEIIVTGKPQPPR